MIDIENLTIGEARALVAALSPVLGAAKPAAPDDHPYPVGQAVLIVTVTRYYTGRLVRVTGRELVIVDAAWIADTGRWADALRTGAMSEVEPYPDGLEVIIPRDSLIDACRWPHALPREQR